MPCHDSSSRFPDEVTNAVIAQGAKVIDEALEAVARGSRTQPPRITSRLVFGPVVPTLWEFTREGAQMIVLGKRATITGIRQACATAELTRLNGLTIELLWPVPQMTTNWACRE